MKAKCIVYVSLFLSATTIAHPINGQWKFSSMHCSSAPNVEVPLRPVIFSDFSPDMSLEFNVDDSQSIITKNGTTIRSLSSTKALSTQSCTKPAARAIPGVFFRQEYHQKIRFHADNETMGYLTGESLGAATQITSTPISPGDCDDWLGYLTTIFGDAHVQGELERVYAFAIVDNTLYLAYQDTLLGSQCGDDKTVLVFEHLAQ